MIGTEHFTIDKIDLILKTVSTVTDVRNRHDYSQHGLLPWRHTTSSCFVGIPTMKLALLICTDKIKRKNVILEHEPTNISGNVRKIRKRVCKHNVKS